MHRMRPVELDFLANAPTRLEFVEPVDATVEAVFAAISADPSTWSWFPGIDEGRYESTAPHGVGATRFVRMGEWEYRETMLAWDPPHRWAYRVDETTGPAFAALAEDWVIEPDGDDALVRWTFAVDAAELALPPASLREVIGPVFGEAMRGLSASLASSSSSGAG
jgi:Polyketide cyclase / dehydrase and lipid transport